MREIKRILVDGVGHIYAEKKIENYHDPKQPIGTFRIERNPITIVKVNGEMAEVNWFAQGDKEWNGKFVVEVEYYPEEPQSQAQEIIHGNQPKGR